MNVHIIYVAIVVFWASVGRAQEIPERYQTTKKIVITTEVKSEVFKDSLKYEKCKFLENEKMLAALNRTDEVNLYFDDAAQVVIEERSSRMNSYGLIKIYDYRNDLSLRLYQNEEKEVKQYPLSHEMPYIKDEKIALTKQKETINGYATRLATSENTTFRGEEHSTYWFTKHQPFAKNVAMHIPQSKLISGMIVKMEKTTITKCMRSKTIITLNQIASDNKEFNITEYHFAQPEYEEEYAEEAMSEEYMEEVEGSTWEPTTWQEERDKFIPLVAETSSPPSRSKAAWGTDSILYEVELAGADLRFATPENWNAVYPIKGKATLVVHPDEIDISIPIRWEGMEVQDKEDIFFTISKIEPGETLHNADGHYQDSGEIWFTDVDFYEMAARYMQNSQGKEYKLVRCHFYTADGEYLIQGVEPASKYSNATLDFVERFILMNK